MATTYEYNQTILMALFVLMALAIPGIVILLDNGNLKKK
jgi:hypothetical protein